MTTINRRSSGSAAALRLGAAVAPVLYAQIAAGGGRFRGIRLGAAWDPDEAVPDHRTRPPQGLFLRDPGIGRIPEKPGRGPH